MSRLAVSLACGSYDRTEALRTEEVQPEGIELHYISSIEPRRIFSRMARNAAFDMAEMSLAYYLCRRITGDFPFIALPVYPSRRFRHGFAFVNTDSGIEAPRDLEGRRIGVTEYRVTGAVWLRGILESQYGVDLNAVEWFEGGLNEPAEATRLSSTSLGVEMVRPVQTRRIDPGTTLSALLASGGIDALISPRVPNSLASSSRVQRLFPDYGPVERHWYRETGVFPIMHVIVMRQALYDEHPWVAEVMYDAFVEAKTLAWERLQKSGALRTMLPWQREEIEEMHGMGGPSMWEYGLEPNREVIELLVSYLVHQGFITAPPKDISTLFTPVVEVHR